MLLAFDRAAAVGFAVFFHNFSTFLGRRGLWLEDLYVKPECRRQGYGRALLLHVARIAHDARLRALRMGGAGLEHASNRLLQVARRRCAGRLDHLPRDRGGAGEVSGDGPQPGYSISEEAKPPKRDFSRESRATSAKRARARVKAGFLYLAVVIDAPMNHERRHATLAQ
mgnify:CR=1 FL=1